MCQNINLVKIVNQITSERRKKTENMKIKK